MKSKIIRNVTPQGTHGQLVNIIYDTIHYVGINKTEIRTINISIRDSQGENIKFSDNLGKVVVKFHFRKK